MPPWYVLVDELPYRPTFPFLVGVMRSRNLLPDSGDDYSDGFLLLQDMAAAELLDDTRESVSVEMCPRLGVPVFHIRNRGVALYSRSKFPATGSGIGRLCISGLVFKERFDDLESLFDQFYHSSAFDHGYALENHLVARSRTRKVWEALEDSPDEDDAVELLDDHDGNLATVAERDT